MMSAVLLALALTAHPQPDSAFDRLAAQAAKARDEDRYDEAIALYRKAIEMKPAWKEGEWNLGALLYQQDHFAEARDALRLLVMDDPNLGNGWALLGMAEYKSREYSRALDHLIRAAEIGLSDEAIRRSVKYEIAALLTRAGRYDESLATLMAMSNTETATPPLIEAAGLAGLRLPLLPVEIPAESKAMVTLAGQAICELGAHQRAEAERSMRSLVESFPDEPGVHFLLGALLIEKNPQEGVAEMKRELEISPDHVGARVRLAEEALQDKNFDDALPLAAKAVALDPTLAAAHLALGKALLGKEHLSESVQELEKARDLAPQVPAIHWALASAYARSQREADAVRERAEVERLKAQSQ